MDKRTITRNLRNRTESAREHVRANQCGQQKRTPFRKLRYFFKSHFSSESLVRKCLETFSLGAIIAAITLGFLNIFFSVDGFTQNLLALACLSVLAVYSFSNWKWYLGRYDIFYLDEFSVLPWSERRLLLSFLFGCFYRSLPYLGFCLVGTLFLYYRGNKDGLTLYASLLSSIATYLQVLTMTLFFSTMTLRRDWSQTTKVHRLLSVFTLVTAFAAVVCISNRGIAESFASLIFLVFPTAWPFGVLWLGANGGSWFLIVACTLFILLATIVTWVVCLRTLRSSLPIVEFLFASSAATGAIARSATQYLRYPTINLPQGNSIDVDSGSTVGQCKMDFVPELLASSEPFDESNDFGCSRNGIREYWEVQDWFGNVVRRCLTENELRLTALVGLMNQREPLSRKLRTAAGMLILCSIALVFFNNFKLNFGPVSFQSAIQFLGFYVLFIYVTGALSHFRISLLRELPYSVNEMVWGLSKVAWLEFACIWPFALAFAITASMLGHATPFHILKGIVFALMMTVSLPPLVVAFGLHDRTTQNFLEIATVKVLFFFFAFIALGALGIILVAIGDATWVPFGICLCLLATWRIVSLFVWSFHNTSIDFKPNGGAASS